MYNVSGIFYRVYTTGLFFLFGSIIVFLMSHFWNREKRNIKELIGAILTLLFTLGYNGYHIYKATNPVVEVYVGTYCYERQDSNGAPFFLQFIKEYVFDSGSGELKKGFYLDSFSKKEIYNQEFSTDKRYRIYYEKDMKVILRVEEIGNGRNTPTIS